MKRSTPKLLPHPFGFCAAVVFAAQIVVSAQTSEIIQEAYLKRINAPEARRFGSATAISSDTAVVGAPAGANFHGTAFVFVRSGAGWIAQTQLRSSNVGPDEDWFGTSVAISGDTIVVGAQAEDAAYIFVREGTNWIRQAYLKASNAEDGDNFGGSVAISGDTVVIGAGGESSSARGVNGNQADNSAQGAGAAYVFVRKDTHWSQQAYLKASNADAFDFFGNVAISGDTIVVGSNNESSSATGVNGNQSDNSAPQAGAAYVFVRQGTTWSQQAYLKASNAAAGDTFSSVAISGDTIAIGASREDSSATGVNGNQANNGAPNTGAAYIFVRGGTNWIQQAYLKPSETRSRPDDQYGYGFGVAVGISGDRVVVSAPSEDSNAVGINGNQSDNSARSAGAAYVFVRSGSTWSQRAYLKASNPRQNNFLGFSLAVWNDTVAVGAPYEAGPATGVNGNQTQAGSTEYGAVYVFSGLPLGCTNCPPVFTLQPMDQLVLPGADVTLVSAAAGPGTFHYQWRFEGSDIPNATNASYSFANVSVTNGHGNFSVVALNEFGSVTSRTALVFVRIRPVMVVRPATQYVLEGQNATFTCVATGAPPILYRWIGTGFTNLTNTTGILVVSNALVSMTNAIRCFATNAAGAALGTNVSLIVIPDFDRDGMADSWEAQHQFQTNNAADALLDSDLDGLPNRHEYLVGTNPTDAQSVLRLDIQQTNGIRLRFTSQSNVAYGIEFRTDLEGAPWRALTNLNAAGTTSAREIHHPAGSTGASWFFRLVTPPRPEQDQR